MWKKILGTGGAALTAAVTIFHAVDPSQLSAKGAAVYGIVGALLALFGTHPASK